MLSTCPSVCVCPAEALYDWLAINRLTDCCQFCLHLCAPVCDVCLSVSLSVCIGLSVSVSVCRQFALEHTCQSECLLCL